MFRISTLIPGLLGALILAANTPAMAAPVQILVIGDSLSEEYAFEIPFSAPLSDPGDANTANWVEILANWRNASTGPDYCDFGSYQPTYGLYFDYRGGGYENNFGIPGATVLDWFVLLFSADFGFETFTRDELIARLPSASVVVIMLGGNDIKADYNQIFNNSEADKFYDRIVNRLMSIAGFVDGSASSPRPVVLCTIPDVGVTPSVSQTYDPDIYPANRASARAKIQAMNDELKTRAAAAGYTIADVHALTLRMEDEVPLKTNGQDFVLDVDPENPPDHLFCRDGFHPGTAAQSVIANEVLAAINLALGTSIEPLANRQVLSLIPGLNPDQPFLDWIAGQGVAADGLHDNPDGDPFDNLAEFAFGLQAGSPDPTPAHDWSTSGDETRFGLTLPLNPDAAGYLEIGAEQSTNLATWSPLDPADITDLGNGRWRASIPADAPMAFLRPTVDLAP